MCIRDRGYTEYYIVDGLAVGEQRKNGDGTERYTLRDLYDESNRPLAVSYTHLFEGTVCTTGMNYTIEDEKFACGYHGDYGQMVFGSKR